MSFASEELVTHSEQTGVSGLWGKKIRCLFDNEEVEKWLLNCARNANKPIPVESAITTKKLNAPRRLPSMRVPNRVTSHQRKRKIEVRYDMEQVSGPV
jgi:hypothetical protein